MVDPTKERAASGQFPKDQSGNPGGRPRDGQKVAEQARSYTKEAIDTLVDIMQNGNDERVRVPQPRRSWIEVEVSQRSRL